MDAPNPNPRIPALNIAAQNAELRRFYDRMSEGIFITDNAMVDSGNGFQTPVGGYSRESWGGFVGSWFNRLGQDPTLIQTSILNQIEKHKQNYADTLADISNLSDDQISLALRNQVLINDIIGIAQHRFASVTRVPLEQGNLLKDKLVILIKKHFREMTETQKSNIEAALAEGSNPADQTESQFITILPTLARFKRAYPEFSLAQLPRFDRHIPEMRVGDYGFLETWIQHKELNDEVNMQLATLASLTDQELRRLGNRMHTKRLFNLLINDEHPNAPIGKLLANNYEFQTNFFEAWGDQLPGRISGKRLNELAALRTYRPKLTAAQFVALINFDHIRSNFGVVDREKFLQELFADPNFISSPHFAPLLVTYDSLYSHARSQFNDANSSLRNDPVFVKGLLYAAAQRSREEFARTLKLDTLKIVLAAESDESKRIWFQIISKVQPLLIGELSQELPAMVLTYAPFDLLKKLQEWLMRVDKDLLIQQLGPSESLDPENSNIARLVPALYPDTWQRYRGLPLTVGGMTLEQYRLFMVSKPVFEVEEQRAMLLRVANENPLNLPTLAEMIGYYPTVSLDLLGGAYLKDKSLFALALLKGLPRERLNYESISLVLNNMNPKYFFEYTNGLQIDLERIAAILFRLPIQFENYFITKYEEDKEDKILEMILTKLLFLCAPEARELWTKAKKKLDSIYDGKSWKEYFQLSKNQKYKVSQALFELKHQLDYDKTIYITAEKLADILPASILPTELQRAINAVRKLRIERNAVAELEAIMNGPVPAPDLSILDDKLPVRFLKEDDMSESQQERLKKGRLETISDLKRFGLWKKGMTLDQFDNSVSQWLEWLSGLDWPIKENVSDQQLIEKWNLHHEGLRLRDQVNQKVQIQLDGFKDGTPLSYLLKHDWEHRQYAHGRLLTIGDLKRFKLWSNGMTNEQFDKNVREWLNWTGKMTDIEIKKLSDEDLVRLWNNREALERLKDQMRN